MSNGNSNSSVYVTAKSSNSSLSTQSRSQKPRSKQKPKSRSQKPNSTLPKRKKTIKGQTTLSRKKSKKKMNEKLRLSVILMSTLVLAFTQQASGSGITSGNPQNQTLVPLNTKHKQYKMDNSIVTVFNSGPIKQTIEYDDNKTIVTEFTDGSSLVSFPPGVTPYQGNHPVTIGTCIGDNCDEFGLESPVKSSKSKSKSKSKPKSNNLVYYGPELKQYGPEPKPQFDIKQLSVKNVLDGIAGFGSYSYLLADARYKYDQRLVSTPLRDAAIAAASLIGGWAVLMAT